jgi:hypothetical protein
MSEKRKEVEAIVEAADKKWKAFVQERIAEAVAAEREACAKIAELDAELAASQNFHTDGKVGRIIAAAIRARGKE